MRRKVVVVAQSSREFLPRFVVWRKVAYIRAI
jgi:hypothetical protein